MLLAVIVLLMAMAEWELLCAFGLLWCLLLAPKPGMVHTGVQILNGVTHGQRPPIPSLEELPGAEQEFGGLDEYLDLMQRCWAQSPADRPAFTEVVGRLKAIAQTAFLLPPQQEATSTEAGDSTS